VNFASENFVSCRHGSVCVFAPPKRVENPLGYARRKWRLCPSFRINRARA